MGLTCLFYLRTSFHIHVNLALISQCRQRTQGWFPTRNRSVPGSAKTTVLIELRHVLLLHLRIVCTAIPSLQSTKELSQLRDDIQMAINTLNSSLTDSCEELPENEDSKLAFDPKQVGNVCCVLTTIYWIQIDYNSFCSIS